MNFSFEFLGRKSTERELLPLFELLYRNSLEIAPTSSYSDEREEWFSAILPALQDEHRHIAVAKCDGATVGFLQYSASDGRLFIEELQLDRSARKTTLILRLVSLMLSNIPDGIHSIEAYAHQQNKASIDLILSLGLSEARRLPDIGAIHYTGDARSLYSRFMKYRNFATAVISRADGQ